MLKTLLTAVLAWTLTAAPAYSTTVTADPTRVVRVDGPIGFNQLTTAHEIHTLVLRSNKPIYILINSPGGEIYSGQQIVQAIRIAKQRGVQVNCMVPVIAASMAFQILANCSKRYVLPSTMLLWHPAKVIAFGLTPDDLEYQAEMLRQLERPMQEDLINIMNVKQAFFFYHYQHETLWTGAMLDEVVPGFLNVVDDIRGVYPLFQYGEQDDE